MINKTIEKRINEKKTTKPNSVKKNYNHIQKLVGWYVLIMTIMKGFEESCVYTGACAVSEMKTNQTGCRRLVESPSDTLGVMVIILL